MKNLLSSLVVSVGLIVAATAHASTPVVSAVGDGFTPLAATQKAKKHAGKPATKAKKHKAKKQKARPATAAQ
jgi:hypothetical protein